MKRVDCGFFIRLNGFPIWLTAQTTVFASE